MPVPDAKTWFSLFLASFEDTTLIILIVSAIVSLAVGFYGDPAKGWIEGAAILAAVLIVAVVTATNDYSKDQQFRALNAIKDNISVQVLRSGARTQIPTTEVLVGDVVLLESGDKVPADGVLIRGADVTANESSLTGEPEDVRKGADEGDDPFLLSGCVLTGGHCAMLVIAVGAESRYAYARAYSASYTSPRVHSSSVADVVVVALIAVSIQSCTSAFEHALNSGQLLHVHS
jgi:P-type Ca2+ transporter type 2C